MRSPCHQTSYCVRKLVASRKTIQKDQPRSAVRGFEEVIKAQMSDISINKASIRDRLPRALQALLTFPQLQTRLLVLVPDPERYG